MITYEMLPREQVLKAINDKEVNRITRYLDESANEIIKQGCDPFLIY